MISTRQLTMTNIQFRAKCLTMIDRLQVGAVRKIVITKCGQPYTILTSDTGQRRPRKTAMQFGGKSRVRH
jgi:predicted metal-binding membrane protein